jgi:hypothetical protein
VLQVKAKGKMQDKQHKETSRDEVQTEYKKTQKNPIVSEIFCIRPDWPWGQPSLLYNGYRLSFPVLKRPGRGFNHPPLCSAEVKEIVELYVYYPSGPSWPVLGVSLSFYSLPGLLENRGVLLA